MFTTAGTSISPSPSADSPSPSTFTAWGGIGARRRWFGRRLRVCLLAVVLAVGLVVAPTLTAAGEPVSGDATSLFTPDEDAYQPEVDERGLAQPTLDTSGISLSQLWIDVPGVDTDRDGVDDTVWAGVLLPNVPSGRKVPTVIHASPYWGGTFCVLQHSVVLPGGLWDPSQPRAATTYGDWDRDGCYETETAEDFSFGLEGQSKAGTKDGDLGLGLAELDEATAAEGSQSAADDNQSEPYYWLSRGFAYMYVATVGTYLSTGCPSMMDGREALGMKAVIDWLNGRQTAHDEVGGGNEVTATDWSTGHAGMTGTSYDADLPTLASTTGVDGLEAIIPISTSPNFYEYYRHDGAVRAPDGYPGEDVDNYITALRPDGDNSACLTDPGSPGAQSLANIDRQTGDYNDWWDSRNLLTSTNKGEVGNWIGKVKAATLIVLGQNDLNVTSAQGLPWYEGLRERGVPTELYMHNANHIDFFRSPRGSDFRDKSNQWFTHYLFGDATWSPDGEDTYHVERVPTEGTWRTNTGEWVSEPAWPGGSTDDAVLYPSAGGDDGEDGTGDADGLGALQVGARDGLTAVETLTDDYSVDEADIASSVAGDAAAANRLTYATGPAAGDLRIQGWPTATLGLAIDRPAANVSMLLVDRAPDGTVSIITRAWTDPQNRTSISQSEVVVPGTTYDLTLEFEPVDYVLPAGHSLALVALSSDSTEGNEGDTYFPNDFSQHPPAGTRLTVDTSRTSLSLPVVGGQGAADTALTATEAPTLELSGSSVRLGLDGAGVTATGEGYAPNVEVSLSLAVGGGGPVVTVPATTDAGGRLQADIVVPVGTATGDYTLTASVGAASLAQADLKVVGLTDGLVVKRGNRYYFKNSLSGGAADLVVAFGKPGDTVLVGDWDGDGVDTLALKRGNRYYFKNSLSGGAADKVVAYGKPGDTPVVGDWDGDGRDTLALKRGKTYLIKNSLSGGAADTVIAYGLSSDTPLAGDWDGDGRDTLAVKRGKTYHIENSLSGGEADQIVAYGESSDRVLAGDWDGDGRDTLATRRGNHYYLKNSLTGGAADQVVAYGESSDSAALSGYWNL